jgi:predicted dehydrogenase
MTIRIAVLGVWHVHADEYVEELQQLPGVELVGVFDEVAARAEQFAQKHGLGVLAGLDEALGDGVDAVVVCSDTAAHERLIGAAIAAGTHVFTEKVLPAELSVARRLEDDARSAGKVLFVSMQRLAEPWVHVMREVIASGVLGTVTASRLRYQHGGVIEGWLPQGFLRRGEAQGGAIIDLGAHGYYLSLLFHGSYPTHVSATATAFAGSEVEDNSVVTLTYPGGAVSTLETSLVAGPFSRWCEVYGTSGFAVVDSRDDIVYVRSLSGEQWEAQPTRAPHATPLVRFLAAIAAGVPDEDNVDAALRLTALVEGSYRAVSAGVTVEAADPA